MSSISVYIETASKLPARSNRPASGTVWGAAGGRSAVIKKDVVERFAIQKGGFRVGMDEKKIHRRNGHQIARVPELDDRIAQRRNSSANFVRCN